MSNEVHRKIDTPIPGNNMTTEGSVAKWLDLEPPDRMDGSGSATILLFVSWKESVCFLWTSLLKVLIITILQYLYLLIITFHSFASQDHYTFKF